MKNFWHKFASLCGVYTSLRFVVLCCVYLSKPRRLLRYSLVFFFFFSISIFSQKNVFATDVGGAVSSDTVWDISGSPYTVVENTLIRPGATLTIEAGVEIRFKSNKAMRVDGGLIAVGKEDKPIKFTHDSEGEYWDYILFTPSSNNVEYSETGEYLSGNIMEYCVIEFVGNSGSSNVAAALEGHKSFPFLNHCIVENNLSGGINVSSYDSVNINNVTIRNNSLYGISLLDVEGAVVGNTVEGNTGDGVKAVESGVNFSENLITGNDVTGISISNSKKTLIEKNIILNNSLGIEVSRSLLNISGNSVNNNKNGGLYIDRCKGGYIKKNLISKNNGPAIFIESSSNIDIYENSILNNTATHGAAISFASPRRSSSKNIVISANLVSGNIVLGRSVVELMDADNVVFEYNVITKNIGEGSSSAISVGSDIVFEGNDIFGNKTKYSLSVSADPSKTVKAQNNWWGTTVELEIKEQVYDWFDNSVFAVVDFSPYMSGQNNAVVLNASESDFTRVPTLTEWGYLFLLIAMLISFFRKVILNVNWY